MNEIDQKEKEVLKELRQVSGKRVLQLSDILEWSGSEIEPQDGQKVYFLPVLKLYAAIEE